MSCGITRRRLISGGAAVVAYSALTERADASIIAPPGVSGRNVQLGPKLSNRLTACVVPASGTAIQAGRTLSSLWTLETPIVGNVPPAQGQSGAGGDPIWVQFIYWTDNGTYTIDKAIYAPSSTVGDGFTPTNASGATDQTMWKNITFNNGGVDTPPWSQASGSTLSLSVSAPASPYSFSFPDLVFSDWMPLTPLYRLDGTNGLPLMHHRAYFATSGRATTLSLGNANLSPICNRDFLAFNCTADAVGTPSAMAASNSGIVVPYMVRYYSTRPGATLLSIGDSTVQGSHTVGGYSGYPTIAAALASTPACPISCCQQGWTGQTISQYMQRGIDRVRRLKPTFATIEVCSPNDPISISSSDAAWNQVEAAIRACQENGTTPILVTATPWATTTSSDDDVRRKRNNVRAYNSGLPVLDWDTLISNGANPARLLSQYDGGDGIHPNDAAHMAAAQALAPLLRSLVVQ